jgi:hypothetical protein
VNLLDVNVLVYAFRRDSERHQQFRGWLLSLLRSDAAFSLSEQVLSSVVRLTTHSKVFREPSTLSEAFEFVNALREHPNCRIARPGDRHWSVFSRLCEVTKAKANLVTDAWFAAMAIESGGTWVTTDRDYARFPGLKWRHPLDHAEIVENPG